MTNMMQYTENEIQTIKANNKLTELLTSLNIKLEKHGKDHKTHCPFHNDTTPSLIVTPSKNLWHCMSCRRGGSVIDFVMQYHNISFLAALEKLNKTTKNKKLESPIGPLPKKQYKKPISKTKLLERVCSYYHKTFNEDQKGKAYLRNRGIKDPAIYEQLHIGYSNGTLHKILPEQGEIIDQLKEIGILQNNAQESFTDSVIFPLYNEQGEITSIYARKITESTIKHLYLKGKREGLLNGHILKQSPEIILTESVIDSLSLYQTGIKNTIPCYGTNGLTEYHKAQLKKHRPERVIISFDNDESGQKGSKQVQEQIKDLIYETQIHPINEAKDLNEYLQNKGEQSLNSFFFVKKNETRQQAAPKQQKIKDGLYLEYCNRKYMIRGIEGGSTRLRANIKAQNCTRFHIDTLDLYSSRARKNFIKDTSILFKEDQDIIEKDIQSMIEHLEHHMNKPQQDKTSNPAEMTDKERTEAYRLGKSKHLIEDILKDIEQLGYLGEEQNKALSYLAMSSRKMEDPLSVMILSASGAGKSALQDTVISLCPPKELVKLTTVTERALFYKEPGSLKHKVLALAEEAGAQEAGYAIRNLISSKELVIEATVKDSLTGRMTTMQNIVHGPTTVFKTTTNPDTDPETRSRFLILTVDESFEQTKRILDLQRENQTLKGFIRKQKREGIRNKHRNFQKLLKPLKVFNPYARYLTYQTNKLWARRDHPKYLQIMNSIAFLHQMQRPIKRQEGIEYIEVTIEDIALTNELCSDILGRNLDELSSPARRLLEIIEDIDRGKEKQEDSRSITRREIREASGWGETYVRKILKELVQMDQVQLTRKQFGRSYHYELIKDSACPTKQFSSTLLNVRELAHLAQGSHKSLCDV